MYRNTFFFGVKDRPVQTNGDGRQTTATQEHRRSNSVHTVREFMHIAKLKCQTLHTRTCLCRALFDVHAAPNTPCKHSPAWTLSQTMPL